jgi:hypothetical protein
MCKVAMVAQGGVQARNQSRALAQMGVDDLRSMIADRSREPPSGKPATHLDHAYSIIQMIADRNPIRSAMLFLQYERDLVFACTGIAHFRRGSFGAGEAA